MFEMIEELEELSLIDNERGKELTMKLNEAKQYLRTDFRAHVKSSSRVKDHCFNFALSDFKNKNLMQDCSNKPENAHEHDMQCLRCEQVRDAMGDFRRTIIELLQDNKDNPIEIQLKEMQELLYIAENKIIDMKRHIIRAEFSNNQRVEILSNLAKGSALITADWGMKWLPRKFRETTIDWFGKRGLSYHISHVLANPHGNGENLMQHTFVHVFENEIQVK